MTTSDTIRKDDPFVAVIAEIDRARAFPQLPAAHLPYTHAQGWEDACIRLRAEVCRLQHAFAEVMDTVTVRVRLLMNADGKWAAYGYTVATGDDEDEVLYDMMSSEDTSSARSFYLTAQVPKPQVFDVPAEVSPTSEIE